MLQAAVGVLKDDQSYRGDQILSYLMILVFGLMVNIGSFKFGQHHTAKVKERRLKSQQKRNARIEQHAFRSQPLTQQAVRPQPTPQAEIHVPTHPDGNNANSHELERAREVGHANTMKLFSIQDSSVLLRSVLFIVPFIAIVVWVIFLLLSIFIQDQRPLWSKCFLRRIFVYFIFVYYFFVFYYFFFNILFPPFKSK